jgi:hypothetical protein
MSVTLRSPSLLSIDSDTDGFDVPQSMTNSQVLDPAPTPYDADRSTTSKHPRFYLSDGSLRLVVRTRPSNEAQLC